MDDVYSRRRDHRSLAARRSARRAQRSHPTRRATAPRTTASKSANRSMFLWATGDETIMILILSQIQFFLSLSPSLARFARFSFDLAHIARCGVGRRRRVRERLPDDAAQRRQHERRCCHRTHTLICDDYVLLIHSISHPPLSSSRLLAQRCWCDSTSSTAGTHRHCLFSSLHHNAFVHRSLIRSFVHSFVHPTNRRWGTGGLTEDSKNIGFLPSGALVKVRNETNEPRRSIFFCSWIDY
jgi:hypothetical protein